MKELNIRIPSYMVLSGRIENWVKNPRDFHPAYCTLFNVSDSLFHGVDNIMDSFSFTASVNLGQVNTLDDIPEMFMTAMATLCKLHANIEVDRDGFYLSPKDDKQVGLGVIGLANLLARFKVTYADFVFALEKKLGLRKGASHVGVFDNAYYIVDYLVKAHEKSAEVAKQYGMVRAFATTTSMSYRHVDLDGYTTAPEISPPLSMVVDRDSDTFGVETYEYHPDVEIASDVGWDVQFRLLKAWQTMMDKTGMAHAISANLWTTYYRLQVDQKALDKSQVIDETN